MSRDFSKLNETDAEAILRDGMKTEFWKYLNYHFSKAQEYTKDQIVRLKLDCWDDMVRVVKLGSVYKSREEILNWPQSILTAIETKRKNQTAPKSA